MTRPLLLALLLALAACTERPFVDAYPSQLALMPPESISFAVCHADGADPAEIARLAQEVCEDRKLVAQPVGALRWQCRMTAPHRALYRCQPPQAKP